MTRMYSYLVFLATFVANVNGDFHPYKRISLEPSEWMKYINKTVTYKTNGAVECGAICSAEPHGACDLYSLIKAKKQCNIGYFSNTKIEYFTDSVTDEAHIYLNSGNLGKEFEDNFEILTRIEAQDVWPGYIYRYLEMEFNDKYDCSALCKNVDKDLGCDLFLFENQVCYLGKSSHSGGSVDVEISSDTSIYATTGALSSLASTLLTINNVEAKHWLARTMKNRTDFDSEEKCVAMALFEKWHFSHYDAQGICHLGKVLAATNQSEISGPIANIRLNLDQLEDFFNQAFSKSKTISSDPYYKHYLYEKFESVTNEQHCCIHCAFDPNNYCDFFIFTGGICYLGKFLVTVPISGPTGELFAYIYKEHLHNASAILYPDKEFSKRTQFGKFLKWTFEVTSELECAAQTALVNRGDFYAYLEPQCLIGYFEKYPHGSPADSQEYLVKVHDRNVKTYRSEYYDATPEFAGAIWTKYISEVIELSDGLENIHCLIECDLKTECDFYAFKDGKCYIGLYSRPDNGVVIDGDFSLQTYHNYGKRFVYDMQGEYFWQYMDSVYESVNWGRFVYGTMAVPEPRTPIFCYFMCNEDPQCEFFTDDRSNCHFANLQHVGNEDMKNWEWITGPISCLIDTNLHTTKITFFSISDRADSSFIATYFVDRNGETETANGLLSYKYWAFGIYWTLQTGNEAECAARCITTRNTRCNFYILANDYCQLGQFNNDSSKVEGSFDDSTMIKLRLDMDIPTLMKDIMEDSAVTLDDCPNSGYTTLPHGSSLTISSDGFPDETYSADTTCRWSIYSPGAKSLKLKISEYIVADTTDVLRIHASTGLNGYTELKYNGNQTETELEIMARFVSIQWYSSMTGVSTGWEVEIESN